MPKKSKRRQKGKKEAPGRLEGNKANGSQKQKRTILVAAAFLVILILAGVFFFFLKTGNKVIKDSGLNVLLLTLDTTRADHIGAYGYSRAKTPNIDALALKGVRFVNAYCPTPLTLPSHCTILTGTTPLYHKVRNNGSYSLGKEAVTLAERLKEAGYATSAFVGSFNVDSRFGLGQGFDYYDDNFSREEMLKTFRSERKAKGVADSFLRWFDENSAKKFFSWVHFYDPHMPYDPPSPYKEDFADSPYDGEIAYTDFHIGRMIEKLREKNILNKTLIVIAGDHGEALGEKEEVDHGIFIYDVTMKVPFILYAEQNIPQGEVINARVRLMDLMPTVLDLANLPLNKEIQGISLVPYLEGKKRGDLVCYLETYFPLEDYGWSPLIGLVDQGWKYIEAPRAELYNLAEDRGEERNVIAAEQKVLSSLKEKLKDVIKACSSEASAPRRKMTLEEEEKLRALGYVGGKSSGDLLKGALPDPKDKIGEFLVLHKAMRYEWEGNLGEAEKYYREMVRLSPQVPWNYVNLAILLAKSRKMPEAIEALKEGLARMPDNFVLLSRLSHFYMREGKLTEAYDMSQTVLKQDPRYFDALVISGWVLDTWGREGEASEYFKRALDIEPENRLIRMKYAYALAALGRTKDALEIYDQLKKEAPDDYRIYIDLGIIYSSLGDLELARENFKKAVDINPSPETYLNYSSVLERGGDLREAVRYLRLYLETTQEGNTPRKREAQKALGDWERRLK